MSDANGSHRHGGYESEIALRDGSRARVRPIRSEDEAEVRAMFDRLSSRTLYLRFHHHVARISDEDIRRFTEVDYDDRFALVAEHGHGPEERIIAIVFYARLPGQPDAAEVAILVEDEHQRLGVGPRLMEMVADVARDHGIRVFEADVLASNEPMLRVLRSSPFPMRSSVKYGEMHVAMPIVAPECEVCPAV